MVGKSTGGGDPLGQDWGRGEQNEFGIYEYYEYPEEEGDGVTWPEVWTHDDLIEALFHQHYGIDLHRVKHRRTARWGRVRIAALLADDNPLSRAVWRTHAAEAEEDTDDE